WSPVDDLLMVQLHRVDSTFEMFIFDPAAGKVLVHEATVNGSYISYDRVIWLPDGRYMESVSSPDSPPTHKRIVHPRTGKTEEVAMDLSHPCYEDILPFSDDNGWTIYRQAGGQTLGLKNILTGAKAQVTSPAPTIRFVDWNRAGTYALIFTDEFCEDTLQPREPVQLWLLSVRSRSLMLVDAYAANPAGWPIGREEEQSAWSPSANSAWYFESNEKFNLIRLPAGISETVDLPVSGEISWNNVFWTPSGDRLIMALTAYQG